MGRVVLFMLFIPGVVVWLGGAEKGGRGEDESSVQLFNNWRNSRALENSLQERQIQKWRKRYKDPESLIPMKQLKSFRRFPCLTRSRSCVCLLQSRSAAGWGCERLSPKASCRSSGAAGQWGQLEGHQETHGKFYWVPSKEDSSNVVNKGKKNMMSYNQFIQSVNSYYTFTCSCFKPLNCSAQPKNLLYVFKVYKA